MYSFLITPQYRGLVGSCSSSMKGVCMRKLIWLLMAAVIALCGVAVWAAPPDHVGVAWSDICCVVSCDAVMMPIAIDRTDGVFVLNANILSDLGVQNISDATCTDDQIAICDVSALCASRFYPGDAGADQQLAATSFAAPIYVGNQDINIMTTMPWKRVDLRA